MTFSRFSRLFVLLLCFGAILVCGKRSWGVQAAPQAANTSNQEPGEQQAGDDVYRHSPSVKKIGGWLHMDKEPAAKLFEYLNFAVLAGAILYALGRYLPKTFRESRESIQHQLLDARAATQQANERMAAIEQRLSHLDEEIAVISKQAEKDTADDEARIKATMEDERRRIVEAVGRDIEAASSAAQRELKRFAAGLAVDRAAQKLSVTEDDDRALMQEFAEALAQHTRGRGES